MRALAVWLVIALLSPSDALAQKPAPVRSISFTATGGKSAVGERVASALVDAGYTLAEASPTEIRTERRTFQNVWDLELRANVLAIDSMTSRVVLTSVYAITCCGMLKRDNVAVEESRSGVSGKMWEQFAIAADRVRIALGPAIASDSVGHR